MNKSKNHAVKGKNLSQNDKRTISGCSNGFGNIQGGGISSARQGTNT